VRVAKSVNIASPNTVSQDTEIGGTWNDAWRATDTQLPPPGERQRTKHGTLHVAKNVALEAQALLST